MKRLFYTLVFLLLLQGNFHLGILTYGILTQWHHKAVAYYKFQGAVEFMIEQQQTEPPTFD